MTPNGVVVAAGALVALAAWLRLGYPPALAVAVTCSALLVVGLPLRLRRRGVVRITMTCPSSEIERGDDVEFTVSATGRGSVDLHVRSSQGALVHSATVAVGAGASAVWIAPSLPRGTFVVSVARVLDLGLLALWRRRTAFEGGHLELTVRPRRAELALPPDVLDGEDDGRPAPVGAGHGVTFAGLREYEAGDDIRHIDWAASARASDDAVYVRQFTPSLMDDLVIVLDTQLPADSGPKGREAFETAVDLAYSFVCSGADLCLAGGHRRHRGLIAAGETLLSVTPETAQATLVGVRQAATTVVVTAAPGRAEELRQAYAPSGPVFRIAAAGEPRGENDAELRVLDLAEAQAAWSRWAGR